MATAMGRPRLLQDDENVAIVANETLKRALQVRYRGTQSFMDRRYVRHIVNKYRQRAADASIPLRRKRAMHTAMGQYLAAVVRYTDRVKRVVGSAPR